MGRSTSLNMRKEVDVAGTVAAAEQSEVAGFTVNGDILRNDRNFFVINLVSSSPLTSRHLDVYHNVHHIKT